jgi:hypothetical protein
MPVRVGHRLQRRISQPIERFFKENELLHQGLSPMELPSATDR